MTAFSVVMYESTGARDLTPFVSDLSFRLVDPGGYGSASFNLSRKIDARDFEDQADIAIYNAGTGAQVHGGRLVDPGRGATTSGEVWEMATQGEGIAHMQERKEPYIVVDTRVDAWFPYASTNGGLEWSSGGPPDTSTGGAGGTTGWRMDVKTGATIPINATADLRYQDLTQIPDTDIGGYYFRHQEGRSSTNHRTQSLAGTRRPSLTTRGRCRSVSRSKRWRPRRRPP